MTPNPAKWKYHQKFKNSKKVLGCLVATNLQGACWISGHLFLGMSGFLVILQGIPKNFQIPSIPTNLCHHPSISQGVSGILVIIASVSLDFSILTTHRQGTCPETHTHKGWPTEDEQQHHRELDKITQLLPELLCSFTCVTWKLISNNFCV